MVVLEDRLSAFLDEAAGWSHAWGEHDSMLLIADWMVRATGRDPAAAWRGRYRTALGARRIIKREGGKTALLQAAFDAAGCARRIHPGEARAGDVGLVEVLTACGKIEPAGAICGGALWMVQGVRGLIAGPVEAVAAWRPAIGRPLVGEGGHG